MKSDTKFEVTGTVIDSLRGGKFKIKLDESDHIVEGFISGKLRMNKISIIEGDKVDIELDVNDPLKGRIIWRHK